MTPRGRPKSPKIAERNSRIRARRAQGFKYLAIAAEFCLDPTTVCAICRNRLTYRTVAATMI
jgi:hypothetical protein